MRGGRTSFPPEMLASLPGLNLIPFHANHTPGISFGHLDTENMDEITAYQLRPAFRTTGDVDDDLWKDLFLGAFDVDGNGRISQGEYKTIHRAGMKLAAQERAARKAA